MCQTPVPQPSHLPRRPLANSQVNDRNRTPRGDVPNRVHSHARAEPGGTGSVQPLGPPAAPIAHISLRARQRHVVGRNTNIPESQHVAVGGIQFGEPVGQIERDVEALPVR